MMVTLHSCPFCENEAIPERCLRFEFPFLGEPSSSPGVDQEAPTGLAPADLFVPKGGGAVRSYDWWSDECDRLESLAPKPWHGASWDEFWRDVDAEVCELGRSLVWERYRRDGSLYAIHNSLHPRHWAFRPATAEYPKGSYDCVTSPGTFSPVDAREVVAVEGVKPDLVVTGG